jgi:hypothetical protein
MGAAMNHFWACGNCDAGGKGVDQADAERLMAEHANGCAAMAKLIIESKLREHSEMLELLRECYEFFDKSEWLGRTADRLRDKLAALLAKFPR